MEPIYQPHQSETATSRLQGLFAAQKAAYLASPYPTVSARKNQLKNLKKMLLENQDAFVAAIHADFGNRSRHETLLAELFPSVEGINHAIKHVSSWSKPKRRPLSIWFQPAGARLIPQPLGLVGIIVPWNYPLYLAIGPLVSALAAGNRALIKMSEFTPQTGELLASLVSRYFPENEVAVVNGGAELAQAFTALPFDHLVFTGSTQVGKHVMRAASDNLTPVTLELGGKSPTIISPDFPIETAAERILYGKCLNAGQTCVAPDYVFVPQGKEQAFIDAARAHVQRWYPNMPSNPDYTSVINQRHRARLQGYLDDAQAKGATLLPLVEGDFRTSGRMAPTIVMGVSDDMRIMQDEIFGPLLPIVSYGQLEEAIQYINRNPRPLALYLFDYNKERISEVMTRTISGGVCINETILHVPQDDLPFGGVGPSGMGHYHGQDGFVAFSKMKPVFIQSRINALALMKPPYGKTIETLLKLMLR